MIIEEIKKLLEKTLETLEIPTKDINIIKSNRPDLCDFQYDGAFRLTKILKDTPLNIGNKIVTTFKNLNGENYAEIECIPPGFINFTLTDQTITNYLTKMLRQEKFGIKMPPKEKIVLDYGGPNVAKPLHVGHLRSAVVGESIKRILTYMNQDVIADVHLGDYGLQIGQVIFGLLEQNITPDKITIELLDTIYPQMSSRCKEDEYIKEKCAKITKALQENDSTYQQYFQKILQISKKDIKKNYDYLDVSFDYWYGESDAYVYIPNITKLLTKSNLLVESEGAKIIPVAKEEDKVTIPPLIYQTGIGSYLYGTTDLATIYQRIEDFHPTRILYVTDIRQKLHFTQVFRVCEQLEYTKNTTYEHLGFGTVNGIDGKPYKTRAGKAPKLEELFKETKEIFLSKKETNHQIPEDDLNILVNSIIKFADLQNNREKDYIFDIQKFSDVVGKTGPYIIYTYLRIHKIVQMQDQQLDIKEEKIYNKQDRELRIKLIDLESTLNYAFTTRLPSVLANYLYEICVLTNAFYENNHINNLEDLEKKQTWINLLNLTSKVIKTLLNLLVIKIPKQM